MAGEFGMAERLLEPERRRDLLLDHKGQRARLLPPFGEAAPGVPAQLDPGHGLGAIAVVVQGRTGQQMVAGS
jgi:hypothetical protein